MITAVVLTGNSEQTIANCLASIRWCDEVVIIDDNSTDQTERIAKDHSAKFFRHALRDDFASQRSFGLSKANGEWVLFVDSDEVVSPELAQEIRGAILTPDRDGYLIERKDWMWGRWLRHGETGNVKLLRLARKRAGRWVRPVHEVWRVSGRIGTFSGELLHYPHPTVAQFLEEINRYSTRNARFLAQQGCRVAAWQIIIYPLAKLIKNYVWYLGFLDGVPGAIVAIMMSFHSFLTRAKAYVLQHA